MSDDCVMAERQAEAEPTGDDAEALFVLGMSYSAGRGVEQNLVTAHKWFNLAAMMGHGGALEARGRLAKEMASDQVAEAQRQARAWLWGRKATAQAEEAMTTAAANVRPFYVRRRAEAMRSTRAFARVVVA